MLRLKNKWSSFKYNYRWSDWVSYIDGWIPRFSFFVPLIGYLILFNDRISEMLIFEHLTDEAYESWGLDGQARLRFIYFSLIFLGISNFIYRVRKPYIFKFGDNTTDYIKTCLEIFTFGDFLSMHDSNRSEGHLTLDGKYYDSEWDGFVTAARNTGEGTEHVKTDASWDEAKNRYGSLLRSLLRENFFRSDIRRRSWLSFCLLLSTVGYFLLMIPSIDLFIKVVMSTVGF